MSSKQELAIVYAALILEDEGVSITVDKINKLLQTANVQVEPFWPGLYVKALEGLKISELINSIGSGVGSGAAAAAAPAAGGAPAAAADKPAEDKKKKEEPKEESDEDMGFGLFD